MQFVSGVMEVFVNWFFLAAPTFFGVGVPVLLSAAAICRALQEYVGSGVQWVRVVNLDDGALRITRSESRAVLHYLDAAVVNVASGDDDSRLVGLVRDRLREVVARDRKGG